MESKLSLLTFGDDRRSLNQSHSALRALTSSRLSRTRPRRDSCSTSSSSSTCSSIDSTSSPSCVFIVWAAVQRNTSQKMTAADRLECPLLRCRKRFPNHEAMLRHLYACDQLFTGEYWCYECGKAEKFNDGKCKRCLGHPGKRRRIMSVAKNFFSSLGQRSKINHMPDLDMKDVSDIAAVPPLSYDSCIQPQQVELSSCTEILEIDSVEVPLPTPMDVHRCILESEPAVSLAMGAAGLESTVSVLPDPSFDWPLQNCLYTNDSIMGKSDRPSLSLHTYGLEQHRKQHQPTARAKNLSPSNSLRSNASTDTTASYLVSPASAFSGAWTTAETSLTSPTSDGSSGGLLSRGCSNASRYSNYSMPSHAFISELPADDIMLQPLPTFLPDDLNCDQQLPLLESSDAALRPNENGAVAPEQTSDASGLVKATDTAIPAHAVDANSLVGSAWDTLKTHITSSLRKLRHLTHNPLVGQLQSVSSQEIANRGLAVLKVLLEGGRSTSSVDMLCFIHVTYSLSLIVHEDDTRNRSKQLFAQAFCYSNWLAAGERTDYAEVASAIWQPLDLSLGELDELISEQDGRVSSTPPSLKGKESASPPSGNQLKKDILLEVARFFLDELEHAVLPSKNLESTEVLSSMLWTKHSVDTTDSSTLNRHLSASFRTWRCEIRRDFSHAENLDPNIKRIQMRIDNGSIRSARRAELELMQAGKGCVSMQEYFDSYVPKVRELSDCFYHQYLLEEIPRTSYHVNGVDLARTIFSGIWEKEAIKHAKQDTANVSGEAALEEFIRNTTTALDDPWESFLLAPEDPLVMPTPLPDTQRAMNDAELANAISLFYETGESSMKEILQTSLTPTNFCTAPSKKSVQATLSSTGQKLEVKASDCCEICGYQPKGDPQWFKGSMAKHKKLQHSMAPPKIYRCPYPGCTSQYKNRPDNLKQHQQDKGHFVDGPTERRPSKRKKRNE
ncbi:Zinc finger protein [Colletotrichum higginsianum IMI 349063]|uniref:Zinc finger protein n=2 Tax=Colletotrichum higginsianum (strain IMI 349063) TaxID=759273 RepID=A0A1B7YKD3_COLHI|nr:Zinc finger protein [Colletotrichum higginsianum IMI 349063]OBR12490.1 Zinc finger protein [Colletotrichum higginsianum IMI 349063]